MMLTYEITKRGIPIESIKHRYAESYPKTRFGSQSFHRSENRINIEDMIKDFKKNKMNNIENLKSIEGPILVIGASGFVEQTFST